MPTLLSPAQYNQAEAEGLVPLCARAIECFRPTVFASVGYPFAITSIAELWRYTECMHEGIGLPQPMEEYLMTTLLNGGITTQELGDARRIAQALDDLAGFIGRPVQFPVSSMLLAFNQARHIGCLVPPGSVIVEIGGGAGYLGALLALRGYRYIATDVSQVFYILQSHLLSRVAPQGHLDLVAPRYGADDLGALQPGQAATVPWWRWAQRSTLSCLSIDLATSNHNLLEMDPASRLYHLAAVRERLSPGGVGFVFEGWGSPIRYPRWTAVKDFADHGFVLAHHDIRIHCFAPQERHAEGTVLRFPLPLADDRPSPSVPPPDRPSPSVPPPVAEQHAPTSFWKKTQARLGGGTPGAVLDERPGLADLTARLGRLEPAVDQCRHRLDRLEHPADVNDAKFATPDYAPGTNPISRAIQAMRADETAMARLTLDDYKRCFQLDDTSTEDDRFLAYIHRGTSLARPWITTLPK